jgi:hypothetical protein
MSIFSILRAGRLTPSWEYRTRGILWRLLPGPGYFVGEDRDHHTRTTSFFCLDEATGIPRWENLRFDEQWWISIETLHGSTVFLHHFARPDLPDQKQVIALDATTGATLWKNEEYKLLFTHQDSVYVAKDMFEGRLIRELDLRTGELQREFKDEPEYVNVLRETASQAIGSNVEFPRPLSEFGDTSDEVVKALAESAGEAEVIRSERHWIVGFYTQAASDSGQRTFDQRLMVFDRETGEIVHEEVIARNARAVVPDQFFLRDNVLFYVKNQNLMRAVNLLKTG